MVIPTANAVWIASRYLTVEMIINVLPDAGPFVAYQVAEAALVLARQVTAGVKVTRCTDEQKEQTVIASPGRRKRKGPILSEAGQIS